MNEVLRFFRDLHALCAKKSFLLFLILNFVTFNANSLNYYWIGGTGSWSDLSHWATTSGGSTLHIQIPTALDDVYFDANSFSSTGQVVTFDALTTLVHNMSWTGVTNTPTMQGSGLLKLYGSLTFAPSMNMNFNGSLDFEAVSPGQTIRMAGKIFQKDVTFSGVGQWTLLDGFGTTKQINLNNGELITNNQTVSAFAFNSVTASARTLNMGSSVFNITGDLGCWYVEHAGMTLNCGTT